MIADIGSRGTTDSRWPQNPAVGGSKGQSRAVQLTESVGPGKRLISKVKMVAPP